MTLRCPFSCGINAGEKSEKGGGGSPTEMGICIRYLWRIGVELLVPTSQERLLTLVQRKKPGVEGYDSNRKA